MTFNGKYQSLEKSRCAFLQQSLTVSDMFTIQMFDLENVGQGHQVQHSQRCRSMANAKLYKSQIRIIMLALTVWQILKFEMFDLENLGHVQWVQ